MSDLIHKTALSALTGILFLLSVSEIAGQGPDFTITDPRDSRVYPIVHIGYQWWMAKNIDIGTMIPGTTEMTDNAVIEKYCVENNSAYCNTFGGIYQWNELMQYTATESTQGICPNGWHIPSDSEWKSLESALGMPQTSIDSAGYRGTVEGGKLKVAGTEFWIEPNVGATNEVGFNLLPAGGRSPDGTTGYNGYWTDFWTSTQYALNDSFAYYRLIENSSSKIFRNGGGYKPHGTSVRCIKNTPDFYETGILTDTRDGQVYKTVLIGNRWWMAENLNVGMAVEVDSLQKDNSVIEKFCYDNQFVNCETYGGLYTWDEMMQYTTSKKKGICPEGWHIPEDGEWKNLEYNLGMDTADLDKVGWDRGTNEGFFLKREGGSGFDALLGGSSNPSGVFANIQLYGYFWSSDPYNVDYSWGRVFGKDNSTIARNNYYYKQDGFSVRCVMDAYQPLGINLIVPDTVCASQEFNIIAEVGGGTGEYSYSWMSDPPGTYPTENTITVAPSTNTIYVLTVDDGAVAVTDSVRIILNPSPSLSITGPTSVCSSEESIAYSTPNNINYQYDWSAEKGQITSAANVSQIEVNWGTTTESKTLSLVIVDNTTGCHAEKQITVEVLPLPSFIIIGPTNVCASEESIAYSTPSNTNYQYNWSAEKGLITSAADVRQIEVNWGTTDETKTLNLVVADQSTGCESQKQISVEIIPVPSFNIVGPEIVCVGEVYNPYSTSDNMNFQYDWFTENGQITTASDVSQIAVNWGITPGTKILNLVVADKTTGCQAEKQISVEALPMPLVDITGPENICAGEEAKVYSTENDPSFTYDWQTNDGVITTAVNISQIEVNWGSVPGTKILDLEVIDSPNGCHGHKQISVEVRPSPDKPDMVRKAPASSQNYIFICKDSGQIYQWYHDGNPIPNQTRQFYYARNATDRNGEISVEISTVNGCKNMSDPYVFPAKSSVYNEDPEQYKVFVHPNPNDGLITIEILDDYTGLVDVQIFNGLGQVIRLIQITKPFEILERQLDLRQLNAGIYFLIFKFGMNREIHRIFINRTN